MERATYTPEKHLGFRLGAWKDMFVELGRARGLAWRLWVRQVTARYRQSVLGYFWAFAPALVTVGTFTFLNRSDVLTIEETPIPYPAYVLLGLTVWQLFANGIVAMAQSVSSAGDMLTKVRFSHEALVLAGFGQSVMDFVIRLLLVVAVFAYYRVGLAPGVLLVPLVLVGLGLLTIGFGFLFALANAVFRDISSALSLVMTFAMFLTPVVYPPPSTWPTVLVNYVNPVSPFLIAVQDLTTTGVLTHPGALAGASVFAVVVFLAGWRSFHLVMPRVVERV